jgi:hypothetical protein
MSHTDPMPHIIVFGNPVAGFEHVGPFDCREDACDYADQHLADHGADYWIVMLQIPAGDDEQGGKVTP